jgi:hypothetical protein
MDDLDRGAADAGRDQLPQPLLGLRGVDPRGTGADRPDPAALSELREDRVELTTGLYLSDGSEICAAGEDLHRPDLVTTHRMGLRTADVETNDLHGFPS